MPQPLFIKIIFFHVYVVGKGSGNFYNMVDHPADVGTLNPDTAEFLQTAAHTDIPITRGKQSGNVSFNVKVV